jgi:intergrase/recombinase
MKQLIQKRNTLLKKLEAYAGFVRGSINSVCARCNRAHCVCNKKRSRKAYRLTYKDDQQKTRIIYIPRNRLPEVKKMITNYSKLRETMEQLMEVNIEIFKTEARS